jgi:hypothetical protein
VISDRLPITSTALRQGGDPAEHIRKMKEALFAA